MAEQGIRRRIVGVGFDDRPNSSWPQASVMTSRSWFCARSSTSQGAGFSPAAFECWASGSEVLRAAVWGGQLGAFRLNGWGRGMSRRDSVATGGAAHGAARKGGMLPSGDARRDDGEIIGVRASAFSRCDRGRVCGRRSCVDEVHGPSPCGAGGSRRCKRLLMATMSAVCGAWARWPRLGCPKSPKVQQLFDGASATSMQILT